MEKVNGIYKLIVEPESAKIVRRIFEEYASGDGIQSIIDRLFEDGVHRISDYNQYHHVYCKDGEKLHQWGNSSIRAVLNRNNYYGDLVQRKYESRFQRGENGVIYWMKASGLLRQMPMSRLSAENCLTKHKSG